MGGADYYGITQLPTDDVKLIGEIMDYIQENEIFSFVEFLSLCRLHKPEWFSLVTLSRGWIVKEIIKSYAWEIETGYVRASQRPKIDRATGEVLSE